MLSVDPDDAVTTVNVLTIEIFRVDPWEENMKGVHRCIRDGGRFATLVTL